MFNHPLIGVNSIINFQEFTTSGTWYRPKHQKNTRAWVMVVGGGGGSNANYVVGGNGCCMMRQLFLTKDSYTVTIGAGGNQTAGGQSSFGSVVVANGGLSQTNLGLPQKWLLNNATPPAFCFEYSDYGYDTYSHYSTWCYKRVVSSTQWFGGTGTGSNSGLGGDNMKGAGYSGYCIIFWEEELKTPCRSAGNYGHLKIQEFATSGTWYRPTRSPATLAFISLKNTSSPYRTSCGTFFLTEDSYTFTTGTTPSFGSIFSLTNLSSQTISSGANLSASAGMYNQSGSTSIPKLGHWALEDYNPANSFIMWYE